MRLYVCELLQFVLGRERFATKVTAEEQTFLSNPVRATFLGKWLWRHAAVGCSVPVAAGARQQPFICLHSPCRATPFIPLNLEHQTGTFRRCVQPVPSALLTAVTNG